MTPPPLERAVEISPPTVQYTVGAPHGVVQFQRRSRRTGAWLPPESYTPTQQDWAARGPAGSPPGYWSDEEIVADLLAYLASEYGVTAVVVESPSPAESPA